MIKEIVEQIGFISMWIITIAAAFLLVSCIVACFVDEIKRIKENRITEKEFRGKKYFKSATNCIKLTDEEIKQTFDFAETFQNFCQRYGLKGSKSSLNLFLNSALRTYKYPEESNKKEK